MMKMQSFLHASTVLPESYNLLKELQDYKLEKCREFMKSISETQIKVLKKISFIAKLRRWTNENPKNYVVFEVNYDGVFIEYPFRCSLEEGLTIVEGYGDTNKIYDMGEKYGLIDLYIGHIPKNLAEYYYKNLTFDAADEDVFCKVKTHEKRMRDVGSMSPEELVAWAKEEVGSPVANEVVLHDNWEYEGPSLDGYIDVRGSSTCCDLVHESVVYDGPSLPHMEKECLANDIVLDAIGTKFPLLLKKKGRSRVNVTRKRTCLYRTKIKRLRKCLGKRVSGRAHYGRLGSLIGLNEHEGDDDPQVTTQVSLTVGSSNNDV
ncbi:hypothetical protein Tco_0842123 [Tanacetum coccineum]|uniref:Transposase n=1 Tax=Tanacetum coccineum TaxID=301880 RepID=A0ABQ5AZB3_9ASTR